MRRSKVIDGKFILIDITARNLFGITNDQYAVADSISCLSNTEKNNTTPGWCHASKEYLADHAGVSRRTIFRLIESLKKEGLIEGSATMLRATKKWDDVVKSRRNRKQKIYQEINKRVE